MTDFSRPPPKTLTMATLSEVPNVLRLAVPIIVGLASGTLIGLVDTLMVAPLGTNALAALGLATSALIVLYSGVFGLLSVVHVHLARAAGSENWETLGQVLADGRLVSTFLGIAAGGIMLAAFPLFSLLAIDPEVSGLLWPYWVAMCLSMVPYAALGLYRGLFNALDRPWASVWIALAGVALNVPLNWVFINGLGTFGGFGLAGAGISSVLAKGFSLFLIIWLWRLPSMSIYRRSKQPDITRSLNLLREGWPAALSSVGEGGSYATAGMMMALFGSAALAANQVVHSIASVMYMLPMGMTAAVSIRVGQAIGGGAKQRVRAVGLAASLIVVVWMAAITGLLLGFRESLAGTLSSDAFVVPVAATLFLTLAFTQFADGMQSTAQGALRGLLDINLPTAITLFGYWVLALPMAYIVSVWLGFGPVGVWIGYGAGVMAAAIALQVRFFQSS